MGLQIPTSPEFHSAAPNHIAASVRLGRYFSHSALGSFKHMTSHSSYAEQALTNKAIRVPMSLLNASLFLSEISKESAVYRGLTSPGRSAEFADSKRQRGFIFDSGRARTMS